MRWRRGSGGNRGCRGISDLTIQAHIGTIQAHIGAAESEGDSGLQPDGGRRPTGAGLEEGGPPGSAGVPRCCRFG